MSMTMSQARIDKIDVSAFEIPTATAEESDGTLVWSSTTLVLVELRCGEEVGLGYTYADPAVAQLIESKLVAILERADPLMPQKAWAQMQMQTRQMGHDGIAAVDIALWALKAKLLTVCLADALPRFRESVPISRDFLSRGRSRCPDRVRVPSATLRPLLRRVGLVRDWIPMASAASIVLSVAAGVASRCTVPACG